MNSTNLLKLADRFEKTLEKKAEEEEELKRKEDPRFFPERDEAESIINELDILGKKQRGIKDSQFEALDLVAVKTLSKELDEINEKVMTARMELDELLAKIKEKEGRLGSETDDDSIW